MKHIDIRGALKFGWTKFLEHWLFLLTCVALLYGGGSLQVYFDNHYAKLPIIYFLLSFSLGLLIIYVYFNIARSLLAIVDGRIPQLRDLFEYHKSYWYYVIGVLLYNVIVTIGLAFFVIPGIYFAIRFGLYIYSIADRDVDPFEALKDSSRLTYGVRWQLLLFYLVSFALIIAGALILLVGTVVAAIVIWLASAYIYRELTNQTKEPIPVQIENSVTEVKAESSKKEENN